MPALYIFAAMPLSNQNKIALTSEETGRWRSVLDIPIAVKSPGQLVMEVCCRHHHGGQVRSGHRVHPIVGSCFSLFYFFVGVDFIVCYLLFFVIVASLTLEQQFANQTLHVRLPCLARPQGNVPVEGSGRGAGRQAGQCFSRAF